MSNIQLWVDHEPFCFGVVQAHTKLSKAYLKKVLSYARSKGEDGGFPKLKWNVWRHMAINKMLFPEPYAWSYLEAFNAIKNTTWKERLNEAELVQQSYETKVPESYKSQIEVNTIEFVIHLFLQQSSKLSLRTSLVGEEWPRSSPRSRSPSPDVEAVKMSGIPNIFDESNHLSFILSNLTDLLELLSEPVLTSDPKKVDLRLSVETVKALGFIIKAFLPKPESIVPLHTMAMRHRFQNKSGYNRATNDFSCRIFEDWVRGNLSQDPFSSKSLLESGDSLPWIMPKSEKLTIMKRCRIVAKSITGHHNTILFLHCSQQTICRQSSLLKGSCVKLNKCNFSQFYLLSPLRSVSIEKCHDSTIVLGPVSKCVRISGCSNVTLIAPARLVIVSSSSRITAHLATPSRPVIIGENIQKFGTGDGHPMVTLAPYHTYYDKLEQHLTEVGLVISPQIDKWNKPIGLSHSSSSRTRRASAGAKPQSAQSEELSKEKSGMFRILPTSEFFSFVIPFQSSEISLSSERTTSIPWGLPKEYSQALKDRQVRVANYKSAVKNADMTRAERKAFQSHVESRFKEWLNLTGYNRELDNLIDLGKDHSTTSD
ncbi:TBCC domain-containing protein 1-like [Styela clava]